METKFRRKGIRTPIQMVGMNPRRLFPKVGQQFQAPAELTCDPSDWLAANGNMARILAKSGFFICLTALDRRQGEAIVRMAVKDGICDAPITYRLKKGSSEELTHVASSYSDLAGQLGWTLHDARIHSYQKQDGKIALLSSMTINERTLHVSEKLRKSVQSWAPQLEDPIHLFAAHYAAEDDFYDGVCWEEPHSRHPTYLIHPGKMERWRTLAPGERIERKPIPMFLDVDGFLRECRTWPDDIEVTEDDVDVDLVRNPDARGYILIFDDNRLFEMNIDPDAVRLGDAHWGDAVKLRDSYRAVLKPSFKP